MSSREVEIVAQRAAQVVRRSLSPVVRVLLLRDVLRRPPADPDLRAAQQALGSSTWVQQLEREQRDDGSWGRFHSRDIASKQRIPTTEFAVERAVALGLRADSQLLARTADYLAGLLLGRREIPDPAEKNDRWPAGKRLFVAATLARIHPTHALLDEDRRLWREIAARTFRSGAYSAADEQAAHKALTGADVRNSYLCLRGKYQLDLLGSQPGLLSEATEKALLGFITGHPDGLGYLDVRLSDPPPMKSGPLDRWLTSWELLLRAFPRNATYAAGAVDWLWQQMGADGTWDFGPRPRGSPALPLSDSWRRRRDRQADWTARILLLLNRYYDSRQ